MSITTKNFFQSHKEPIGGRYLPGHVCKNRVNKSRNIFFLNFTLIYFSTEFSCLQRNMNFKLSFVVLYPIIMYVYPRYYIFHKGIKHSCHKKKLFICSRLKRETIIYHNSTKGGKNKYKNTLTCITCV